MFSFYFVTRIFLFFQRYQIFSIILLYAKSSKKSFKYTAPGSKQYVEFVFNVYISGNKLIHRVTSNNSYKGSIRFLSSFLSLFRAGPRGICIVIAEVLLRFRILLCDIEGESQLWGQKNLNSQLKKKGLLKPTSSFTLSLFRQFSILNSWFAPK